MFRRDKIDIVNIPHILEFDEPVRQFLGRDVETVLLMRDIVVLAKDAAEIATGEEDTAASMSTLNAWLFAEVRRDCIDDDIGTDKTCSATFEAVHAAEAGTEIAISQMSVGFAALLGFLLRGQELVSRDICVEEKLRSQCGLSSGSDSFNLAWDWVWPASAEHAASEHRRPLERIKAIRMMLSMQGKEKTKE